MGKHQRDRLLKTQTASYKFSFSFLFFQVNLVMTAAMNHSYSSFFCYVCVSTQLLSSSLKETCELFSLILQSEITLDLVRVRKC